MLPFSSIPCVVDEHGCTVGYTNKTKYSTILLDVKVLIAGTDTDQNAPALPSLRAVLSLSIISNGHTAMYALPLSVPQIDILEIHYSLRVLFVQMLLLIARHYTYQRGSCRPRFSPIFLRIRFSIEAACVCVCECLCLCFVVCRDCGDRMC